MKLLRTCNSLTELRRLDDGFDAYLEWRDRTWMAEHVAYQEIVELVTDYLERALPADRTSLFEQHIDFCDGCRMYVEQMRTTVAKVGRVTEEDVPPKTRERLLTAFPEWER